MPKHPVPRRRIPVLHTRDLCAVRACSPRTPKCLVMQAEVRDVQFSGAMLLGRGVSDTVRSKIADYNYFKNEPEVMMYGMMCALAAAGLWLLLATYLEMPVSTTHSIVGCAQSPPMLEATLEWPDIALCK
jgi:hypothetical protein